MQITIASYNYAYELSRELNYTLKFKLDNKPQLHLAANVKCHNLGYEAV